VLRSTSAGQANCKTAAGERLGQLVVELAQAGGLRMEIHELVVEIKLLERRLTLYEEKYGVLSDDFYTALMSGKLADYDAYDETRADFSRWKGIYETWQRRKAAYREQLEGRELAKVLRVQPAY
jgi:hypothetical protein